MQHNCITLRGVGLRADALRAGVGLRADALRTVAWGATVRVRKGY